MSSILVFVVVTLTWIPFRSSSLEAAIDLVTQMLSFVSGAELAFAPVALLVLGVLTMFIDRASERGLVNPLGTSPALVRGLGYGAAIAAFALFSSQTAVPFIYFQF